MRASAKGAGGNGDGDQDAEEENTSEPSPGGGGFSGSFFNFGERAAQSQKAKMLAKLNTPHKRYEKKVAGMKWSSSVYFLSFPARIEALWF